MIKTYATTLLGDEPLPDSQLRPELSNNAITHGREVLQLRRPRLSLLPANRADAHRHPTAHVACTEVLCAPVLELLQSRAENLYDADLLGHVRELRASLRPHLLRDMQSPRDVAASF